METEQLNIKNYIDYIKTLRKSHKFISYSQFQEITEPYVLWRHDIDFSIENALELAIIENELKIKSIYFIHLHNENYNFLDRSIQKILLAIKDLGHELELHLCCDYYTIKSRKDLINAINLDREIFEKHLGHELKVFSFHNPTEDVLIFDDFSYGDLINTYSKELKSNTIYASDSNGYWRHLSIGKTIAKNPQSNLQILTHPIWWNENAISPREKIVTCINSYATDRVNNYDEMLKRQGRRNIK